MNIGSARAVFALVKDLLGFVIARIEIDFRLSEDRALASLHVVTINGPRRGEAGESVKGLSVFALAVEADHRPDAWQIDLARKLSAQVE